MIKEYQEPMLDVLTLTSADVLTLSEDKADGDLDWE